MFDRINARRSIRTVYKNAQYAPSVSQSAVKPLAFSSLHLQTELTFIALDQFASPAVTAPTVV